MPDTICKELVGAIWFKTRTYTFAFFKKTEKSFSKLWKGYKSIGWIFDLFTEKKSNLMECHKYS